ncbi:mitochondrial import inner membrane translocase subunit TIM14 [Yamadazyma tenuis]|uniref:Mitochondrial import inner membrane translocase subunit TIM14 n=1 Tax=Candida tenuis (strain ATCC 10573 / BCRC 21748 / CBS 615 / JCM 9827 / NBRC 10315 / NRRL Y-1498 / VKM Y-70) TaxID=590646 RepID=G3B8V5_CANTC|nr:uncharacterized protein CANTEDRAFT_109426 [Yamadazyma tenuis ATCC 10573]EGV61782.1 hypothetical protein CANTEDRAFT_109426 [Yamadazyma tenuis ATCC 10573]WEJ93012.1 mitochondrial import inner membrane translocase subunit TIM14 [Yamadazyma tenuis]
MAPTSIQPPILAVTGDDPTDQQQMQHMYTGHLQRKQAPEGSAEWYFDQASDWVGEHPWLTGIGAFGIVYAASGLFKSKKPGFNGKTFITGGFGQKMSAKEALQILNLKESTLSQAKLKEQHRRLMLANHPDKGGSAFLATKVNEAKDFLEKRGGMKKK